MFLTACLGFQAVLTELIDGACSLPAQLQMLQGYRDFLDELPKADDAPSRSNSDTAPHEPADALVRVEHLSFAYQNTDKAVLNDVSFDIKRGECVALVGANGAGKTTLVRLLAGFYQQYDGAIFVNGADGRSLSPGERARAMSILFQNYLRPSMSVAEATSYAADAKASDVLNALNRSAYDPSALPDGIHTQLTRAFSKSGVIPSGGQWQKLALARMFYRDAPLYVLDEPSASLDPQAEDEIFGLLSAMKGEHAIQLFDRKPGVIYLRENILDGRIVVFDNEEEALRLMIEVKENLEEALNVKLRTIRYDTDPRKDKPYKISEKALPAFAQTIADCSVSSTLSKR